MGLHGAVMPTWDTRAQRGAQRGQLLLRRVGDELRTARTAAGLSSRAVGALVGLSHVQVIRIERGLAPHVGIETLARIASVLGHELSLRIHPIGPPVRDKAHVALLQRFAARLGADVTWQTEVPIPLPGDLRSADGVVAIGATARDTAPARNLEAIVEAETRLHDVQATERRLRAKQRDLGTPRAILLVADTRHNRRVIAAIPEIQRQFPVGTRTCLAALKAGRDPDADCLVIL